MTIEEVQAKKAETESAIRLLIHDFCKTTGLFVESISMDAERVRFLASNDLAAVLISSVTLNVRL
jgi:hypothetical protein